MIRFAENNASSLRAQRSNPVFMRFLWIAAVAPLPRNDERGFTLIELVVVTAVIIIVSSVMLASNSRFGGVVLLNNFAYDMALSIRQAQVYGIAVKHFNAAGYPAGYGMEFKTAVDTGDPTKTSNINYVLFGDNDSDSLYGSGEFVQAFSISRGFKVSDLCTRAAGVYTCGKSTIDITFRRPESDAWIADSGVQCITTGPTKGSGCMTGAQITVVSPRGDRKYVCVEINGQIYVKSLPCT